MDIAGICAVVTGGASGLGRATVERLVQGGAARVVLADLASSNGKQVAESLGDKAIFVAADVRSPDEVAQAITVAAEGGPLRVVVHCAGRGGAVRVVNKDGTPGSLETYTDIVTVNLVGSFNVLRLAAAEMAATSHSMGTAGWSS
jgi:NAD(P)-dependent dehydrogenase (short-subunit alcohol dehydrogenase family)